MYKKKQFILIYSVSVSYVQMLFFISSNSIYHWPVLAVVKENVEFLLVRVIAIAYSNFSVYPPLILQYYLYTAKTPTRKLFVTFSCFP